MPVEVKMPQLGESTYEGTIGKWLKQPGDAVERFEPLVEIITDKVNVEMPAPFGGTLTDILVAEGTTVTVGTPIAMMETAAGAAASTGIPAPPPPSAPHTPAQGQAADGQDERVRLSPVVRRLAEEHGVPLEELARVRGSGAGGRVTKDDIVKYLDQRRGAPPEASRPAAAVPARG